MKQNKVLLLCWAPLAVLYMSIISIFLTRRASIPIQSATYCFVGIAFIWQIILEVRSFIKKEATRKIALGYLGIELLIAPITLWVGGVVGLVGVIVQLIIAIIASRQILKNKVL